MQNNFSNPKNNRQLFNQSGYILPLVIITGMILVVGAVILSAQSFSGLMRSTRQKQSDEAVEIAETGVSLLINELNKDFPYLLTVDCQVENNSASEQLEEPLCAGWENFEFGQQGATESACPARSEDPELVMDLLYKPLQSQRGSYRLRNYEFLGDQIQGGKAIIQVQGQRFKGVSNSSDLAASAIIEQEITIAPKCCDKPPFVDLERCAGGEEKIPGLLTKKLSPGGLDVFGDVHTINSCPPGMTGRPPNCNNSSSLCENQLGLTKDEITPELAGQASQACNFVSGDSTFGDKDFPIAPTWAEGGDDWVERVPANMAGSITGGISISHTNKPDYCITTTGEEGKKTTSCRIKSIAMSGTDSIELDPGNGHINFYLDGGQSIASASFSGRNIINTGGPDQFSIIAGPQMQFAETVHEQPPKCSSQWSPKQISISGEGVVNAFIFASCADVVISGNPVTLNGNIISRNFTATANDVQINTPEGSYGSNICKLFDLDICTQSDSRGEFAAVGINQWSLIQMEQE